MTLERHIPWVAGVIAFVGIATLPMRWVPIISAGGLVLEVPNAVSAVFALILPFAILISRRMWRIHLLFGLLVLWSLLYFLSMTVHNTPLGIPIMRQEVMQTAFGWTLALAIAHSNIPLSRIGFWGLICLGGLVYVSSLMVGVDIISEVLNYIFTGDRNRFLYRALRPIFNAFVGGSSDVTYVASLMNDLAMSIVMLVILVFLADGREPGKSRAPVNLFALGCMAFAFLLFSTSAIIVILLVAMVFGYRLLGRASDFQKVAIPLLALMAAIVVAGPLDDFIGSNLAEDGNSRGARLGQYAEAMDRISENMLTGDGYFEHDGFPVHNWPLFSWSTAGYVPFLIVIGVYLMSFYGAAKGITFLKRGDGLYLLPLFMILLVRTAFGGGGGVPSGSAIVAMAVIAGILERRRRELRQREEPRYLVRIPDRPALGGPVPG